MLRTTLILLFSLLVCTGGFAQNETAPDEQQAAPYLNPNALAAKLLFIDYGTINAELGTSKISNGIEFTYIRNFGNWLNLAVPAKIGLTTYPGELSKTTLAGLDAVLQVQYYNGRNRLVPYAFAGGGFVTENFARTNLQIPFGVGLNVELGKNSYLNLQAEIRKSTSANRNNMQYGVGYMFRLGNAEISEKVKETTEKEEVISDRDKDGISDKEDECPDTFGDKNFFGCPDSDADGVPDTSDDCPQQPGTLATLGCPDTDKDGIPDAEDDCPEGAGTIKTLGCPDSDGDGLADNEDECPDAPGKKKYNGCPDSEDSPETTEIDFAADDIADQNEAVKTETPTELPAPKAEINIPDLDRDGVPDAEDKCPREPGSKNSNGCPDSDGDGYTDDTDECPLTKGKLKGCPDSDGDGVNDATDNCPDEKGEVSAGGCPPKEAVEDEDLAVFVSAARDVRFETGSDVLLASSYEVLETVKETMLRYPNFRLMIEGHTDNVGDKSENQILSENRAKACYMYLVSQGVSPLNVQYIGYGEMRPLADNDSKRGRQANRRVEFKLEMK